MTNAAANPGPIVGGIAAERRVPRLLWTYSIGDSSEDESNRRVGWPELTRAGGPGGRGPAAFVKRWIDPLPGLGFEQGGGVWNPWGTLKDEGMRADQLLSARRARLHWLYDGFVEAWTPVAARAELIMYTGGLRSLGPVPTGASGRATYLRKVVDCFSLIWGTGASQGLDTDSEAENGSAAAHVALLLDGLGASAGAKVYIESWWERAGTWGHHLPIIIRDEFYRTIRGQGWPDWARKPAEDAREMPEVIRIVDSPGQTAEAAARWFGELPAVLDQIMAVDGHSAMVPADVFVAMGKSVAAMRPRGVAR